MRLKYQMEDVISDDGRLAPVADGLFYATADINPEGRFHGEAGRELIVLHRIIDEIDCSRADIINWAERVRAAWAEEGAVRDDLAGVVDEARNIARMEAESLRADEAAGAADFLESRHSGD